MALLPLVPSTHPSTTYTPPPGLARWSILHGGLPSFRLRQHYSITPAQPPSAYPSPLNRVPETHEQVPSSIQDAVSYRIRPIFASPLLSSLNGADLPFLRTIFKAVLTIWSQFSEYEFDVILSALSELQAPFPGANASDEIESSAPQGRWGEFTLTLGFGRGNIEEKSGERWGYRECSALNLAARQSPPLSKLKKTCLNLVHDIRS